MKRGYEHDQERFTQRGCKDAKFAPNESAQGESLKLGYIFFGFNCNDFSKTITIEPIYNFFLIYKGNL